MSSRKDSSIDRVLRNNDRSRRGEYGIGIVVQLRMEYLSIRMHLVAVNWDALLR